MSVFSAHSEPVKEGVSNFSIPIQGGIISKLEIAFYNPPHCKIRGAILLFSGMERNYRAYRNAMENIAHILCLQIYSPYFDKEIFPPKDYQRGGESLKIIPSFLSWIKKQEKHHNAYFMIGHSAGGQFLERLLAYQPPKDIQKFIIMSPSSYVIPSETIPDPYGFFNHPHNEVAIYLQQPLAIFIGEEENKETSHLLKNQFTIKQGASRLERAKTVFLYAQNAAISAHIPFNWSLHIMPNMGHDFKDALNSSFLKEELQKSLNVFEKNPI